MGDRIRRSWLIVPARRARLEEAAHAGADVIVLDLQDTVHDTKKHIARARVRETIRACVHRVLRCSSAPTSSYFTLISTPPCGVASAG